MVTVAKVKQLKLWGINVLEDNYLFILARYLIIFSIDIRNHIIYNIGHMKKKEEYCYTQCRVGCNKQTKHAFVNTGDKTQIILACCECVLKKEKKVCGTRTQ